MASSLSFIFMVTVLLSSWYKENLFHMGFYLPLLERKRGGSEHASCTCCLYKVPLAQNNPYATVARLGEAYSATLHRALGTPLLLGHLAGTSSQMPDCHTDSSSPELAANVKA